jgi:ACDE family multidrug resistance protein
VTSLQKKSILPFSFLCAVPLIMVLGNSMLIPILPQMKQALNISQLEVGLVITLFSVPAGLTIPLAGLLSDRLNRKWIIAGALTIYAVGGLIAGLSAIFLKTNAYLPIMVGRVLQGIGAAGTAPISMALASDIFTSNERSKVLGMLESSNGLGKVASPILGSIIGLIAWWAVFFVFPILCIPIALGMLFVVKEPQDKKEPQPFKQYFKDIKTIFKNKGVSLVSAFFAGTVVLFVLFGVLFYLSDHLESKYKIEGVLKGLILAIPVLAMAITSYITGSVTQKEANSHKPLVVVGTGILAVAMVVVPFFSENTYIMVAALVFAGIGTGLVLPCLNTMITSSCNADERGMITALYNGVRFFGVAAGPPLFGVLMEKSVLWTFLVPAILAALAGVVNFFFCHEDVLTRKPEEGKDQEARGYQQEQQEQNQKQIMSKQVLQKLMLTAKIQTQPSFRPAQEVKDEVVKKVIKRLQPKLQSVLKEELKKELEELKKEVTGEIEKSIREAVTINIEEVRNDNDKEVKEDNRNGKS